jgi:uncharacterized protein YggE
MDQNTADSIIKATHWPRMMAATALGVLALFLLAATFAQLKSIQFIGSGVTASNTITVSGEGYVFAVPDTATFSVTVQETAKDVKTAQDAATKKNNAIMDYLKKNGVDAKDIQTTDYNVYPQYDYGTQVCPMGSYCPPGRQTLSGYQVNDTLTVKVRDTKKAGDILSGVGGLGASQVSGLSFTVDDPTSLQATARGKAIDDARTKAMALAQQLGVRIVRVVGYNEGGGGGPVYFAKAMSADSGGMGAVPAAAPEIATGQNKITSDVNVTYEIQ